MSIGSEADWKGLREVAKVARLTLEALVRDAQPGVTTFSGLSVVEGLCGHGVGRTIHEEPSVPNRYDPRLRDVLTDGLVLTIEPMISAGSARVSTGDDGWTLRTLDGSLSAHYENTLVITRGEPIVLTGTAA